jgi:uncharacterized protein YbjT (DUF2867 family)
VIEPYDAMMGNRILVTGATGYIGGRLVPELLAAGHEVVCLARDPDRLRDVPWAQEVTICRGDVTDAASLEAALEGADTLYYLVHSIAGGRDFAGEDRRAATTTVEAAHAQPGFDASSISVASFHPHQKSFRSISPHVPKSVRSFLTARCRRWFCKPE